MPGTCDLVSVCSDRSDKSFTIYWNNGDGAGEITFVQNTSGLAFLYSEKMGKEFVKGVLCKMIDDSVLEE